MKGTKAKPRRVEVIWLDATFNGGTFTREEASQKKLLELRLLAYEVAETDAVLVLASEYDAVGESFRYVHTIPKAMIVRTRNVR